MPTTTTAQTQLRESTIDLQTAFKLRAKEILRLARMQPTTAGRIAYHALLRHDIARRWHQLRLARQS